MKSKRKNNETPLLELPTSIIAIGGLGLFLFGCGLIYSIWQYSNPLIRYGVRVEGKVIDILVVNSDSDCIRYDVVYQFEVLTETTGELYTGNGRLVGCNRDPELNQPIVVTYVSNNPSINQNGIVLSNIKDVIFHIRCFTMATLLFGIYAGYGIFKWARTDNPNMKSSV